MTSRILHKSFRYVPAAQTNIANTFRRVKAELKAKAEAEKEAKVRPIKRTA